MKNFFSSLRFKILVGVAVVLIGIILGNATVGRRAAVPSSFFSTLASPFQTLGAMLKNGVSGIGEYFSDQKSLLEENRQLNREVSILRERLTDYEEIRRQNQIYEQMLEITDQRPDFKMVEALVTVRSSEEYYNEITINRGSLSGIKVKDPVVTSDGVVGFVNEVGLNYAKVTTLFSPEASIGGYDITTHDYGILAGSAELLSLGQCKMAYLPKDSLISVGDIITTSGLGGNFPAGLVVGIVARVTNADLGVSVEAVITPTVDFSALREVMIITDFEPGEMPAASSESTSEETLPQETGSQETSPTASSVQP